MARLVVKTGPHRGMSFESSGERVSIGRDQGNRTQLPDATLSAPLPRVQAQTS